jgi:copper chaperone NosL
MIRLIIIAFALMFQSCNTQPEALIPGKDICVHCKMPVADTRFGAELISSKGKIYKFDDINCMLQWKKNGGGSNVDFKHILVVNYFNPIDLMQADKAVYLKSDKIRTPMNSGFAAFSKEEEAKNLQQEIGGTLVSWQQVVANIL